MTLEPKRPRFRPPAPSSTGPAPPASAAPPGPQQLAAVRQFVARVGGIENARNALALLAILSAQGPSPNAP